MSGARIAAKVARGIAKAGRKTGGGPYPCTIRRAASGSDDEGPTNPFADDEDPAGDPQLFPVFAVKSIREVKDMSGALIGVSHRKVMIAATGVRPLKSDRIALGVAPADVDADTKFHEILRVHTEEPTDVPLYHDLYLAI